MMRVVEFIRENGFEALTEQFGIKLRFYPEWDLVVLNYDQLESPRFNPIVEECRGLILDTRYLNVISRTFKRFYNLNENPQDQFDFDNIDRVEEKADGSLMSVYYYRAQWHVASRGTAFAESTTASGRTLRSVFEEAIGTDLDTFMVGNFPSCNYVFELCSLHNKVIKIYEEPIVYLLAVVDTQTGQEIKHRRNIIADVWKNNININLTVPKQYVFDNVTDIVESFKEFPPTDEGYVLVDQKGNRIKVKNPTYIDLHHLKGNGEITPARICDIVFRGETEEVLSYFPEYRQFFEPWQDAYNIFIKEVDKYHELVYNTDMIQKDFALAIKDVHFKGILFGMRKGFTLKEVLDKASKNTYIMLLEHWVQAQQKAN